LKYLRSATFGSKDIVIRKSEFVAKTQFLYPRNPRMEEKPELKINSDNIFETLLFSF